jgi:hypothetical protein
MFDPMKAFINLPTWLRITIGLSIAAGMFLWIGISAERQYDREEPLMKVCWSDGVAHYPETQEQIDSCSEGVIDLMWTKKTKTLRWDLGPEYDVYKGAHQDAVDWVNDELGFDAVELTEGDADITIVSGSVNESSGRMHTSHTKVDDEIRATITIHVPGDTRQWMLEEQHEILHALGLAHKSSGIMRKTLEKPGDPQRAWLLRDNDRKALRELLL